MKRKMFSYIFKFRRVVDVSLSHTIKLERRSCSAISKYRLKRSSLRNTQDIYPLRLWISHHLYELFMNLTRSFTNRLSFKRYMKSLRNRSEQLFHRFQYSFPVEIWHMEGAVPSKASTVESMAYVLQYVERFSAIKLPFIKCLSSQVSYLQHR